jgi:uncharacterized membrane protein (UPF0127 family)
MTARRCCFLLAMLWACNRAPSGGQASAASGPADFKVGEASETGAAQVARSHAKKVVPQGDPQPQLALGTVELEVPPRAPLKLRVEVAATDRERQYGLMFRKQLGDDQGMLFLFPTERYNSFWMRNTLIPLDMFFIDSEWNVVGVVENAEPLTDDARQVDKMSRYVLEVNAGFAARHQIGAGAKVTFVPPPGLVAP